MGISELEVTAVLVQLEDCVEIEMLDTGEFKELHEIREETVTRTIFKKIAPMVAIAVQIAADNVSVAHYALRVTSQLLDTLTDADEKKRLIGLIYSKLRNRPNSAYLQIWLQNITHTVDEPNSNRYDMPLCRLVNGEVSSLWNNDWLVTDIADGLPLTKIINRETLAKAGQIITFREHRAYTESQIIARY